MSYQSPENTAIKQEETETHQAGCGAVEADILGCGATTPGSLALMFRANIVVSFTRTFLPLKV
jgi:hypothetical protein